MNVNRKKLLAELEAVSPGLAKREQVEQSASFVFRDGRVTTFNDEVSCSGPSCLEGVEGAVEAESLLKLLGKLNEEEIDVGIGKSGLLVKSGKVVKKDGKVAWNRKASVRIEKEILLPVEAVETPQAWEPLADGFAEAVRTVLLSVGTDESQFGLTCVHIHTDWVETCDNFQMTRWPIDTGLVEPVLVRGSSLRCLGGLDATEWSLTETWMHFRSDAGLVLSCRRYEESYALLDDVLNVSGTKAVLPAGLLEIIDRAEIFSSTNATANLLTVVLRVGQIHVKGKGSSGWYEERKKAEWAGPDMEFKIAPGLLAELSKLSRECTISESKLKVDGGKFAYVTCTGVSDGDS